MTALPALHKSEQGFVLVFALVMLILLTVLGVWATQTSVMDTRIATNERLHKEAFYHADSGLQLAERLLFVNAGCIREKGGFKNREIGKLLVFPKGKGKGGEGEDIADFADQRESELDDDEKTVLDRKDHFVFLYFPNADMDKSLDPDDPGPIRQAHTTVQAYYEVKLEPGNPTTHDSGYLGRGFRGIDSGVLFYTIESRHKGYTIVESRSKGEVLVGGKSKVREQWKLPFGLISDWTTECKDQAPYAGW